MKKIAAFVCCFLLASASLTLPAQAAGQAPQIYSSSQLIFLPPDNLNLILYIAMLPILFLIGLILGLIKNPSIKKWEKKNKKRESLDEKSTAPKQDTPAPYNGSSSPNNYPEQQGNPGNRYRRYW